jgi:hypothetical protein
VHELTDFEQQQLRQTTSPAGLPEAERIVRQLSNGG